MNAVQNRLAVANGNGNLREQRRIIKIKNELEDQQMKTANNLQKNRSNVPTQNEDGPFSL